MSDWLHALLPPYNFARLFAFTRYLESKVESPCQVCAVKDELIAELREQAEKRENYILSLLGQRPINVAPQEPKGRTLTATGGRSGIKALRTAHVAAAVAKAHSRIDEEGMESRAVEYAARVSQG